ncbi:MAG: hypothetical protein JWP52_1604, partial [Rhizobacter sp.]|nr:hypothetical protein [Rhizobacter sp.]
MAEEMTSEINAAITQAMTEAILVQPAGRGV